MKETRPVAVDGTTKYTNLVDLEEAAKKHLTANAYGYYSSGAEVSLGLIVPSSFYILQHLIGSVCSFRRSTPCGRTGPSSSG